MESGGFGNASSSAAKGAQEGFHLRPPALGVLGGEGCQLVMDVVQASDQLDGHVQEGPDRTAFVHDLSQAHVHEVGQDLDLGVLERAEGAAHRRTMLTVLTDERGDHARPVISTPAP
jgi:hypothetical protein